MRVVKTLRAWDVRIDEAFFLGGVEKARILGVLRPHIFFDDQITHCEPAAAVVPTALVPVGSSNS
jgi:5'-nucleotidase